MPKKSGIKLSCGCVSDDSGYGYCGECTRKLREKIWKNMNNERRNYDRHFSPEMSEGLDKTINDPIEEAIPEDAEFNTGCSCHINPPCSYCTDGGGREDRL